MNKMIKYLLLLSLGSNATLFATDYYFDSSALPLNSVIKWSESGGTADTDGVWRIGSDSGEFVRGVLPTAEDTIYFNNNGSTAQKYINLDVDVTVKGIIYNSTTWNTAIIDFEKYTTDNSKKLTVLDTVIRTNGGTAGSASFSGISLDFRSGFTNINNTQMLNCGTIKISGNMTGGNIYWGAFLNIKKRQGTSADTFANGMLSPDIELTGYTTSNIYFSENDYDTYAKLGGVRATMYSGHHTNGTGKMTYIILTNSVESKSSGVVSDLAASVGVWNSKVGKMQIAMAGVNGVAQEFSNSQLTFQGGVKAISGTLNLAFAQNASKYTYKTLNSGGVTVIMTKGNSGTDVQTQFSHGNLEMLGGTFGSTGGYSSEGFRFTDIVYTSGTIKLRMTSETEYDRLDLTSYYIKDTTVGAENPYTFVKGGTIKFADDASESAKVVFDFGDCKMLINSELNEGKGAKIIAWNISEKTSLQSSDFYAAPISAVDEYVAKFEVADDGLYVKYVDAVPEPLHCAVLFGFVALALAVYKRKK